MRRVRSSSRLVIERLLLCAATMFLIAVASPGTAQTRVDLEARADADVQGGAPDVNYGDDPLIHVGNPDKTVFVWFDLSSIPADATIERARLEMTAAGTGNGPNEVRVGAVRAGWRERQITYANQPDVAWSRRVANVDAAGPVRWNVTPAVAAWHKGEHDNFGLALRGDGPIWALRSSESPDPADRPRLQVAYTTGSSVGTTETGGVGDSPWPDSFEFPSEIDLGGVVVASTCDEDLDCGEGRYCDKGIALGVGRNQCTDRKAFGQTCTRGGECLSDRCAGLECAQAHDCMEDSDCGSDEYCNLGVIGVGRNECKGKLEDHKACTKDHQCASGHCSQWRPQDGQTSGICYTPNSKLGGESCEIDLECVAGKCNSKDNCVCRNDADCPSGYWCDQGLDLHENSCKAKLDKGQVCGTVGEIGVGHRCKSGKCKVSGLSTNLKCQ